jgi:hypothetical protein
MQPQMQTSAAQLMQLLSAPWMFFAVSTAAKLRIAEHLAKGPLPLETLADRTKTHAPTLLRLLRATEEIYLFTRNDDGHWQQTPLSAGLTTPLRELFVYFSEECLQAPWARLADTVRTGGPAFPLVHGMDIWRYAESHAPMREQFNRAMAASAAMEAPIAVQSCDFTRFRNVADIGGGTGHLLAAILEAAPEAEGTLFDLPETVAKAEVLKPFGDRARTVGGNMFESVPAGCDAYVMRYVLHDWSDAECAKILQNMANAVYPGGRLIVFEAVVPEDNTPSFSKWMDLVNLTFLSGKQRTNAEFTKLFDQSGWEIVSIKPTPAPFSVMEARAKDGF